MQGNPFARRQQLLTHSAEKCENVSGDGELTPTAPPPPPAIMLAHL